MKTIHLAALLLCIASVQCVLIPNPITARLSNQYSVENVKAHLAALEDIAVTVGDGNRSAGTPGYDASVDYVVDYLSENTNYTVTLQELSFTQPTVLSTPQLSQTAPESMTYTYVIDFTILTYSGSGDVTAKVDGGVGDGCSSSQFSDFTSGSIAVIARGQCDFSVKAQNAVSAGAVGVIIYNYVNEGIFSGTLGSEQPVPVFGVSYELADDWIVAGSTLNMVAETQVTTTTTHNVIAETPGGNADSIIVVGSHLDSVADGPGINDNGSGSSSNLEMARSFMFVPAENKVQFCWWAAEELGLIGSTYYVDSLVQSGAISNIALNLNYDMVASPNFFRGIYDGNGASADIRNASVKIMELYEHYFDFNNIDYRLTEFNGRSDYGPFISNGVPAGGLFTGAEEIKPANERQYYGGIAEAAYDTCYHKYCDDNYNINDEALEEMGLAGYYVLVELATTPNLNSYLGSDSSLLNNSGKHRHSSPRTSLPTSPVFTRQ